MASLQDELAALDSSVEEYDTSFADEHDTSIETFSAALAPCFCAQARSPAPEKLNFIVSDSQTTSGVLKVRSVARKAPLRLKTSVEHLKQGKRDTYSPNTLRKLLSEPSDYEGTRYGDPEDDSEPEASYPGLDSAMGLLQGLCDSLQNETADESSDIRRFAQALGDLRPQSSTEMATSRCIAAHETLATAMPRKLNALRDLSMQVTAGYLHCDWQDDREMDEDHAIERAALCEALTTLIQTVQDFGSTVQPASSSSSRSQNSNGSRTSCRSRSDAVAMLGQLYVKTAQLLQDLASLSDALNMLRQTALDVSRKLRTVKDHVEAMQREYSQAERSRMMLESGQWHIGIADRMAARQCRDICGGFEGTFERLRGRLVAQ